jgi:hypothetical protein
VNLPSFYREGLTTSSFRATMAAKTSCFSRSGTVRAERAGDFSPDLVKRNGRDVKIVIAHAQLLAVYWKGPPASWQWAARLNSSRIGRRMWGADRLESPPRAG